MSFDCARKIALSGVDRRQHDTNAGGPCQSLKSLPLFFGEVSAGSPGSVSRQQALLRDNLILRLRLWLKVSARPKSFFVPHLVPAATPGGFHSRSARGSTLFVDNADFEIAALHHGWH